MGLPTTYISAPITLGGNISSIIITIYYTGDISFEFSNDGGTTWEAETLTSGIAKTHTFSSTGGELMISAIGLTGAMISTQFDSYGQKSSPGISLQINYA